MATFRYEGTDERTFPTIGVTVKPGETFEAPTEFSASGVVSASDSKKPSAPAVVPNAKIQPSDSDKTAGE